MYRCASLIVKSLQSVNTVVKFIARNGVYLGKCCQQLVIMHITAHLIIGCPYVTYIKLIAF